MFPISENSEAYLRCDGCDGSLMIAVVVKTDTIDALFVIWKINKVLISELRECLWCDAAEIMFIKS